MTTTRDRDWSELPDLVLLAVLHRLSALLDLFAFAGVCRSWRSILSSSAAADYIATRPPLLLRHTPRHLTVRSPPPQPVRCHLQTLDDRSYYNSLLSDQALADLCLGYSHGHLILIRCEPRRRLLLADVLTGAEIRLPELPHDRYRYYYAALTAPPSSPDSLLLLFYSEYALLCCRLSGGEWSRQRLGPGVSFVVRVMAFKGRVYAVNDLATLLLFDFSQDLSVKPLEVGGLPKMLGYDRWHFGPQLVECGGELLLVLFVQEEEMQITRMRIHAHRMDFGRMLWVEVQSLGDYALFIDCGGKCPVSLVNPGSWGLRSNCIYMAGPGYDTWCEFPLDGKTISTFSNSLWSRSNLSGPRWPSSIWIYPSMFY